MRLIMKYEIVELEEKIVEGIAIKTSNQNVKSIQDIGETWQKLFANGIYEKIQNKVNNKTIGLYTEAILQNLILLLQVQK